MDGRMTYVSVSALCRALRDKNIQESCAVAIKPCYFGSFGYILLRMRKNAYTIPLPAQNLISHMFCDLSFPQDGNFPNYGIIKADCGHF